MSSACVYNSQFNVNLENDLLRTLRIELDDVRLTVRAIVPRISKDYLTAVGRNLISSSYAKLYQAVTRDRKQPLQAHLRRTFCAGAVRRVSLLLQALIIPLAISRVR